MSSIPSPSESISPNATENVVTAWLADGTQEWELTYQLEGQGIYVSVTQDRVFVSG